MHISEGVLSASVLTGGAAAALAGTVIGLKKISANDIPKVGILASAFFVASLIHVPVGVSSVHLVLNGLLGLLLGWAAVPAILVALFLQMLMFQFGGLTTLGVNTVVMAAPAVLCYYIFGAMMGKSGRIAFTSAFLCGFFSIILSAFLLSAALGLSGEHFLPAAKAVFLANLPLAPVEGLITAFTISFLMKVKPELVRKQVDNDPKQ